jgi:hypothetical protein
MTSRDAEEFLTSLGMTGLRHPVRRPGKRAVKARQMKTPRDVASSRDVSNLLVKCCQLRRRLLYRNSRRGAGIIGANEEHRGWAREISLERNCCRR